MQRIAIIGNSGSGKSTLGVRLGEILGLPVHHLDLLFWLPGWDRVTRKEFERRQRAIVVQSQWIIEGNYGSTMDLRLEAVDTVIFLDFSTVACLRGIISRKFAGKPRLDTPEGCVDTLDPEFFHYVVTYRMTRRPGILRKLAAVKAEVIVLKSRTEVGRFVAALRP